MSSEITNFNKLKNFSESLSEAGKKQIKLNEGLIRTGKILLIISAVVTVIFAMVALTLALKTSYFNGAHDPYFWKPMAFPVALIVSPLATGLLCMGLGTYDMQRKLSDEEFGRYYRYYL